MDKIEKSTLKLNIAKTCFDILDILKQQEEFQTAHDEKVKEYNESSFYQNITNIDWIEDRLKALKEDKELSKKFLECGFDITRKIYDLRYMIDEIMLEDAKLKAQGEKSLLNQAFIMFMNMSYDMINNFGKSKHGPKTIEELQNMITGLHNYALENDEDLLSE